MLTFQKLRWKNFLSTGNAFSEIDFRKHKTTLFVGKNGAGKSTFIDALCFVLFNKPYRGINKPQLVNSINKKELVVEVEFFTGLSNYLIRRGIKPALFEIYQNGELLNKPGATKDYQEQLEKHILKMGFKSFTQIVILGSAKFSPFMRLSAADRRAVIDDIMDIEVVSVMAVIAKQRLAETKKAIFTADTMATGVVEREAMIARMIEQISAEPSKPLSELKQDQKKFAKELVALLEECRDEREYLGQQNAKLLKAMPEHLSHTSGLFENKVKLEMDLTHENEHVQFFLNNTTCPTCDQEIAAGVRTFKLAKKADRILDLQNQLDAVLAKYEQAKATRETLSKSKDELDDRKIKFKEVESLTIQLKQEIAHIQREIEQQTNRADTIAELQHELAIAQQEKLVLGQELESLIQLRDYQDACVVLLKDSGIKAAMLKEYIPVINQQINKYLQAMDFFVGFTLDENFEETIKSRFRDEFSYHNFSAGQQMRIDLAILFTWRDIARMRNSVSTNVLIIDEIFDSSLDADGTDDLMKILDILAKEAQIFLISHKTDQLSDRFERVIRLTLKAEFSNME